MKRDTFLKWGTLAAMSPFANHFFANASPLFIKNEASNSTDLLNRMMAANDKQVEAILPFIQSNGFKFSRKIGTDFSSLVAAYCSPNSKFYHSELVISKLEILTGILKQYQTTDGTVNIANLESPPDTAFLIELLTAGAFLLQKEKSTEVSHISNELKSFLVKSGEALITGGVHTPNHRWVISAALARLHALYPNKRYTDRIEDWLGEGIYQDKDGHYPERSAIYSGVENTAFITLGRLLNKPALYEAVRKNLSMTYYYMEPNGDLVTNDSRRQDQYMAITIFPFYLQYRYLAIHDKNSKYAGIVQYIESLPGFERAVVDKALFQFLEEPLLQQELPIASTVEDMYEKFLSTSNLLRIKRGNKTTTLFGGIDWPIIIASGRSNSPNFFAYRKGNAILKYARLSSSFFSMGYFYSEGIKKEDNRYVLHKKLEIPYYQPLPKNLRNKQGDYTLSPSIDDRFWNKMDFEKRPVSNVKTMETTVSFLEKDGSNELQFKVTGLKGVAVTIELCFQEGGKLTGVTSADETNYFLEQGVGKFEMGGDTIEFGPGNVASKVIAGLEGERYSTHFGTLKTTGMHVYITGVTPFEHTLVFS